MQAIDQSSIKAAELNTQLRLMAEQLQPAASDGNAGAARQDAGRSSEQLHLPGLQDVRGQWSGSIQAYGGGSSATSCDFDVKGQWWQWGPYGLDALLANGSFHSEEGVALQEVGLHLAGLAGYKHSALPGFSSWISDCVPCWCTRGHVVGTPCPPHPLHLSRSLSSRRGMPSCRCAAHCWGSIR